MAIINNIRMQASLTSLRSSLYGQDTIGGGDSGEPYIIQRIPPAEQQQVESTNIWNSDNGLIRGGFAGATQASVTDLIRIGKFIKDPPRGPLFIIKQVGLQLSNPQLEAKQGSFLSNLVQGNFSSALGLGGNFSADLGSTRIYNLGINTLAQVPLNAFGGHIIRHGALPIQSEDTKYQNVAIANDTEPEGKNNRLVKLKGKLEGNTNTVIKSYISGPGSVDGIGVTTIQRYSFALSNPRYMPLNGVAVVMNNKGNIATNVDANGNYLYQAPYNSINYYNTQGVSLQYFTNSESKIAAANNIRPGLNELESSNQIDQNVIQYGANKEYSRIQAAVDRQRGYSQLGNSVVVTNPQFTGNVNSSLSTSLRNTIITPIKYIYNGFSTYAGASGSLPLSKFNIDKRLGLAQAEGYNAKDEINLTPLYYAEDTPGSSYIYIKGKGRPTKVRDEIKFRIEAVDNDSPKNSVWMIFRSYLKDITDNPNPSWNTVNYVGRGEPFYIYKGFERNITFTLQVAAMSEDELRPIYQKLNYLYSNTMPDYSSNNVMRAPYMRLTLGDYMFRQPGVIKSMTYSIGNDSPWEIAIDEPESGGALYELPHVMTITMTFAPIHDFLPRKFPRTYGGGKDDWKNLPAFVADRQTIDSQGTPGNPWLTGIYDSANEIPKGVNSDGIPPPIAVPLTSRGLTGVNLTPASQLSPSAATRGFQSSEFDNSLLLAPRSTIVDSPNAPGFNAQADRSRREDAAENRLLGITP